MNRLRLILCAVLLLAGSRVQAQTIVTPATAAVMFNSADEPLTASYQGILIDAAADAVSGVPLQTGPVVAKSLAVTLTGTSPIDYKLTFSQLGLNLPACLVAPQSACPKYALILIGIGTNGLATSRGVLSVSNSFQVGSTAVPPAVPTNVRVK